MRVLVVDNYDSFVYNLVQYLAELGADVEVWRNDDSRLTGRPAPAVPNSDPLLYDDSSRTHLASALSGFDGVLLSPGPGVPEKAGATPALVSYAADTGMPLLGVCLGHQAIGHVLGATVERARQLMHGKTSAVSHDGSGVLDGIPSPVTVMRYHSLTVVPETLPDELIATAHTEDGTLMAVRHRSQPIHGVQFHPESIGGDFGHAMLANWMRAAGFEPRTAVIETEAAASAQA